jgi:hypothetical protein
MSCSLAELSTRVRRYIEALAPVFKKYAVRLVENQKLYEEEFGCLRAIIASLMNISLGSYGTFALVLNTIWRF